MGVVCMRLEESEVYKYVVVTSVAEGDQLQSIPRDLLAHYAKCGVPLPLPIPVACPDDTAPTQ